jgi:hypothetical protein
MRIPVPMERTDTTRPDLPDHRRINIKVFTETGTDSAKYPIFFRAEQLLHAKNGVFSPIKVIEKTASEKCSITRSTLNRGFNLSASAYLKNAIPHEQGI